MEVVRVEYHKGLIVGLTKCAFWCARHTKKGVRGLGVFEFDGGGNEMDKNRFFNIVFGLFASISLVLGGTSCAQQLDVSSSAWIDYPSEGATLLLGAPITIISHGFAREGVAEVVLSVNGEAYRRDVPAEAGNDFVSLRQDWIPVEVGLYTLQVQVYDRRGASGNPATVSVEVVGEVETKVPTPVEAVMPVVTETPTPVITATASPVPSIIQFYSYPPEISAGACATIYWNAENVQRVIFDGTDQAFSGSYETCLCTEESYTLRVIHLDGTEEQRTVTVNVTGSCEVTAPPLAADTQAPPAPVPAVPANGLELSCRSTQTLAWLPADDPSGISGYYVKVERENTPGQWQSVAGYGPIPNKQVGANVDCGVKYRWAVRAQDGAGNFSEWSAFSQFSVTLD